MSTLVQRKDDAPFLRRALALDAAATGAMGLLMALAAEPLSTWLQLPLMLLREAGIVLLFYVAFLIWLLRRERVSAAQARSVIGINVAWVLASFAVLASGLLQPNALGATFVIVQAVAVAVISELQYVGLKRALRGG